MKTLYFILITVAMSMLTCICKAQVVSSVTASPSAVCIGSSTKLNGISPGNVINWYDDISAVIPIGTSQSGEDFTITPTVPTAYFAEAGASQPTNSITYNYTGNVQSFIVPEGVTYLVFDVMGAQGCSNGSGTGGKGGRVQGVYPVIPGQELFIYVGEQPSTDIGGWNGGGSANRDNYYNVPTGGGGASDIRIGGNSLSDRIIVAGAGGGAARGTTWTYGGSGGGLIGGNGSGYGKGGTQTAGGISYDAWGWATSGTLGNGGNGASLGYGGGGGGGYYGGAGGGKIAFSGYDGSGGGGGSSYANSSAKTVVHTQGYKSGHGQIIISWSLSRSVVIVDTLTITQAHVNIIEDNNNICQGTSINFTSNTINGGSNPIYQWYINDNLSGTNSPNFNFVPNHGDIVKCILTSNIVCPGINPIVSNEIGIAVSNQSNINPVLSITESAVCKGGNIKIKVETNPNVCKPLTYKWQKDEIDLNTANSPTLDLNSVNYSDEGNYRCIVSNSFSEEISNVIFFKVKRMPSNGLSVNPINLTNAVIEYIGDADISANYSWDFAGGTIISGSQKGPFEIKYNDGGYRRISLSITEDGCVSPTYYSNDFKVAQFQNTNPGFPGIYRASMDQGDYNNDGLLDVLMTGSNMTRIYKNSGNNVFSLLNLSLPNLSDSYCSWGDFNNDGMLDFIVCGNDGVSNITKIFKNEGNDIFSELNSNLPGVKNGSVKWIDYNNDGLMDIILSGVDNIGNPLTKLFKNDKNENFVEIATNIVNVKNSSIACGDYNNNGYTDIIILGNDGTARKTKIYKNVSGNFIDIGASIVNIDYGYVAWGDYDNDGFLDIAISGMNCDPTRPAINSLDLRSSATLKIYHNDGNGGFSNTASLSGYNRSTLSWGDIDNDGDIDLAVNGTPAVMVAWSGVGGDPGEITFDGSMPRILRNEGNNLFTDIQADIPKCWTNDAFHNQCVDVFFASYFITFGDFNNDNILEILRDGNATIYKNGIAQQNLPPGKPTNLRASVNCNNVTLQWDRATDDHNSANSIFYKVYVGTSHGSCDILSKVNFNSSLNISLEVNDLTSGTYYWSVKAIDNSFSSSEFAQEELFTFIEKPTKAATPTGTTSLCLNPTNQIYTTTGAAEATSYIWTISPSNAGTITGTGTTATVDFDNAFTGTAQITVAGQNNCGIGETSGIFNVEIGTVPTKADVPTGTVTLCSNPANQDYTTTGATNATSYVWAISPSNAGAITGTGTTANVDFGNNFTGTAQISVTGQNDCGNGETSDNFTVTIGTVPTKAVTPIGTTTLCSNPVNQDYTTTGATNATSYVWAISPVNAGTITGTGTTATIDFDNAFIGTAQITVKGQNNCGNGETSDILTITIGTVPTKAAVPSGTTKLCVNPSNQTYTTTRATDATYYVWAISPPNAGTITGSGTTATVDFDNTFTGTAQISVVGQNTCGNGQTSDILTITIGTVPTKSVTPIGTTTLCSNPANQDYTTTGATNATSYVWAISPANAGTIINTGTTATVDFENTFTGTAQIIVTGQNDCGNGEASDILTVTIGTMPTKATQPSGPTTLCLNPTNQVYTTTDAIDATTYLWSISPDEAGIIKGTGITASVDFNNSFIGTAQITVTSQNNCGNGKTSDILNVTIESVPEKAGVPNGESILCINPTNQTYFTEGAIGATKYLWAIFPANAGTISGTDKMATVDWNNSFSGTATIGVIGQNQCGNGLVSSELSVIINTVTIIAKENPTNSGIISGAGDYLYDANISLMAIPETGFIFTNWTENGTQVSASSTYSFTANESRTLLANFIPISYSISANEIPTNSGTIKGIGSYTHGENVTLEATPLVNYKFINWTENGKEVTANATYTFIAINDRTLVANFAAVTGFKEEFSEKSINIFPNPNSGQFTVKLTNEFLGEISIKIYGARGNQTKLIKLNKSTSVLTQDINIQNFAKGEYFVEFQAKKFKIVKTISIN